MKINTRMLPLHILTSIYQIVKKASYNATSH